MKMKPRALLVIGLLPMVITCAAQAQAGSSLSSNYPSKPVRLIVGFATGSATDITARIFAQRFTETWDVPVIVENVVGAGGSVGVARVAKAPPDGYTLAWGANGAMTIAPTLQANLQYDPTRDLAPISLALMMPSLVVVNNELPARTLQELIALAKARPGQLSYATPGSGTPQHVGGELLKSLAGVDIAHVPYKGAAQALADVISGRVAICLMNSGSVLPMVRDGRVRAVAVTSLQRSTNMPDLPTVSESGFPGFEATSWFGLFAPARTPEPIISKVHQETLKALAHPALHARLVQLGLDSVGSSPGELAAIVKSDIAKWATVIRDARITASD